MKIASININKRLGNREIQKKLSNWLILNQISLLCIQEPYKIKKPISINGFQRISGNEKVESWINNDFLKPINFTNEDFYQKLQVGYLIVFNCYLDAYNKKNRASQLKMLDNAVRLEGNRPVLLIGDFNLAPDEKDGIYDGKNSNFNSLVDRKPFQELINNRMLIDTTKELGEYSVEKIMRGKKIQFRCDLALVSDYFYHEVMVRYDHIIRDRISGFTDHSAAVIEVPISLLKNEDGDGLSLFDDVVDRGDLIKSYKTAIARLRPSPFAVKIVNHMVGLRNIKTILDYGCGYGADVKYYRENNLKADGYDPYQPFGWSSKPNGKYDLITCIFVLNVLADIWQRLEVIKDIRKYMCKDSVLLVVARSPKTINKEAINKNWAMHNDGYWSHQGRKTFQKGISKNEMLLLTQRIGLIEYELPLKYKIVGDSTTTVALFKRRS